MKFTSKHIEENVNVSKTHPLAELAWLAGGLLLLTLIFYLLLGVTADLAVAKIPIKAELWIGEYFVDSFAATENKPLSHRLQKLLDNLPADSPLHDYFEWDNPKAAHKYRLFQANLLVNHIEVVYQDKNNEPEPIRAFLYMRREDGRERVILPTVHIMTTDDLRLQAIEQLRKEARSWAKRARKYEEFANVVNIIEEVLVFEAATA